MTNQKKNAGKDIETPAVGNKAMHTPGPWVFGGKNSWEIVDAEKGKVVCSLMPIAGAFWDNSEIRTANARLIASAPDMLQMLKDTARYLKGQLGDNTTIIRLKLAAEIDRFLDEHDQPSSNQRQGEKR